MTEHGERPHGGEEPRVVVRDRRRIDPQTGQAQPPELEPEAEEERTGRHAAAEPESPTNGAVAPAEEQGGKHELQTQLEERTADLQRLSAEYANYRKRVDRDREVAANSAKANLVRDLLAVLDDVERAEVHGDLTGAFKTVADKLVTTLQQAGLESFGDEGEPFDPSVHEAVQHDTSPEVAGPTVTTVLRRGYRFGERVVRAALVGVTDHEPGGQAPVVDAAEAVAGESVTPTAE